MRWNCLAALLVSGALLGCNEPQSGQGGGGGYDNRGSETGGSENTGGGTGTGAQTGGSSESGTGAGSS